MLIVVPTLNEEANVTRVVEGLLADAPASARLVVVDGGSTDGTRRQVQRIAQTDERVRLLDNPDRLQSAAINLAARTAGTGTSYLIRADAHAIYPRGFCRALIEEAEATGATAVTVRMWSAAEQAGFQQGVAAAQNSLLGTGGSAHRVGPGGRWVDHGHHALISLPAFRAVGGYDGSQSHNEDAELDVRLRRAGGHIWLAAGQPIRYIPRSTPASLFRQYMNYGRGRAFTILRHRMAPRLRQALPLAALVAIALAVAGLLALLLGGTAGHLLLPAIGWALICCGYGALLAVLVRVPGVLWAGPAAMIMHLAWALGFVRGILEWPWKKTPCKRRM